MVMAARRTYADAVSWVRSARPPDFARGSFALKAFGAFFVGGVGLFGLAAIAAPASFGQEGARTLGLGWPSAVLAALIVAAAVVGALNRRYLAWFVGRNLNQPFSLGPEQSRPHDGAVDALAACVRPMQVRFALGWSWMPALAAVVGALLAVSAAYFAIYALLAGFDVGAETAVVAVADVVLSFGLFVVAAARLSTWRLATAVYRTVAPGML